MMNAVEIVSLAWLVYGTTMVAPPAQSRFAIEYPSMRHCQAQLAAFTASIDHMDEVAKRKADKVTINVKPYCTDRRPAFWVDQ